MIDWEGENAYLMAFLKNGTYDQFHLSFEGVSAKIREKFDAEDCERYGLAFLDDGKYFLALTCFMAKEGKYYTNCIVAINRVARHLYTKGEYELCLYIAALFAPDEGLATSAVLHEWIQEKGAADLLRVVFGKESPFLKFNYEWPPVLDGGLKGFGVTASDLLGKDNLLKVIFQLLKSGNTVLAGIGLNLAESVFQEVVKKDPILVSHLLDIHIALLDLLCNENAIDIEELKEIYVEFDINTYAEYSGFELTELKDKILGDLVQLGDEIGKKTCKRLLGKYNDGESGNAFFQQYIREILHQAIDTIND